MLSLQVGPIFDLGYTIVTSKLYLEICTDLLGKMMQKRVLLIVLLMLFSTSLNLVNSEINQSPETLDENQIQFHSQIDPSGWTLSPNSGSHLGGDEITITGSDFSLPSSSHQLHRHGKCSPSIRGKLDCTPHSLSIRMTSCILHISIMAIRTSNSQPTRPVRGMISRSTILGVWVIIHQSMWIQTMLCTSRILPGFKI